MTASTESVRATREQLLDRCRPVKIQVAGRTTKARGRTQMAAIITQQHAAPTTLTKTAHWIAPTPTIAHLWATAIAIRHVEKRGGHHIELTTPATRIARLLCGDHSTAFAHQDADLLAGWLTYLLTGLNVTGRQTALKDLPELAQALAATSAGGRAEQTTLAV